MKGGRPARGRTLPPRAADGGARESPFNCARGKEGQNVAKVAAILGLLRKKRRTGKNFLTSSVTEKLARVS